MWWIYVTLVNWNEGMSFHRVSRQTSAASRTCSRNGRRSLCSIRQAQSVSGASLATKASSNFTKVCLVCCREFSTDWARSWSFSTSLCEVLTFCSKELCSSLYLGGKGWTCRNYESNHTHTSTYHINNHWFMIDGYMTCFHGFKWAFQKSQDYRKQHLLSMWPVLGTYCSERFAPTPGWYAYSSWRLQFAAARKHVEPIASQRLSRKQIQKRTVSCSTSNSETHSSLPFWKCYCWRQKSVKAERFFDMTHSQVTKKTTPVLQTWSLTSWTAAEFRAFQWNISMECMAHHGAMNPKLRRQHPLCLIAKPPNCHNHKLSQSIRTLSMESYYVNRKIVAKLLFTVGDVISWHSGGKYQEVPAPRLDKSIMPSGPWSL